METMTTKCSPTKSRRPHRLGIDAHTEFVRGLVSELDAAVGSLLAAANRLAEPSAVDLVDPSALDDPVGDVRRLVHLLDTIDGPGDDRYLQRVSLPDAICEAAKGLDLDIVVSGAAGPGQFLCDPEAVQLGAELVLSALASHNRPVRIAIPNDHLVLLGGALDLADERRVWQLRSGRRVLEGENCRVRLVRPPNDYRLEIRALES
jgi:hypothetical protein